MGEYSLHRAPVVSIKFNHPKASEKATSAFTFRPWWQQKGRGRGQGVGYEISTKPQWAMKSLRLRQWCMKHPNWDWQVRLAHVAIKHGTQLQACVCWGLMKASHTEWPTAQPSPQQPYYVPEIILKALQAVSHLIFTAALRQVLVLWPLYRLIKGLPGKLYNLIKLTEFIRGRARLGTQIYLSCASSEIRHCSHGSKSPQAQRQWMEPPLEWSWGVSPVRTSIFTPATQEWWQHPKPYMACWVKAGIQRCSSKSTARGVNLGSVGCMRLQLRPTSVLRMHRRRNWDWEYSQREEHRKNALRTWRLCPVTMVKENNSGRETLN